MRALILVDLDNVLSDGDVLDLAKDARARLQKLRSTSLTDCVTAFAFNTVTAYEHDLTWESLETTARAFATAVGAARSLVEVALALTMPQTADVLLARLARRAPDEASSGHYHLAVLMTKDGDLIRDLGAEAFARDKSRWVQVERGWPLAAWAPTPGAAPLVRKPPERARASGSEPVALSGAYTEVVSHRAHAGWAATRAVDLEPGLELKALSLLVDDDPWLVSQVGATRASLRGLSRLPVTAESLGAVCENDGVELRGDAPRPTRLSECEPASVGIGALRFPNERATLASRLPLPVLRAAGGGHADRQGVMVRRVLQTLSVGAALGDHSDAVKLRLRADGRDLVAKVKHGSEHQPGAWWLVGETATKSEQRVRGAAHRLPSAVQTTALPYRTDGRSSVRVALRCPLEPGVLVRCDAAIAQGTIGQTFWDPPFGKPWPIAVLALRSIEPTRALRVEPVHSADRGPAELRELPLMVAQ